MDELTAHSHFMARDDRSICEDEAFLEFEVTFNDGSIERRVIDAWPAFMTAAALLSGMLEGCQDDADLDEAVEHYKACSRAGIFDEDGVAIGAETERILDAFLDHGSANERQLLISSQLVNSGSQ